MMTQCHQTAHRAGQAQTFQLMPYESQSKHATSRTVGARRGRSTLNMNFDSSTLFVQPPRPIPCFLFSIARAHALNVAQCMRRTNVTAQQLDP